MPSVSEETKLTSRYTFFSRKYVNELKVPKYLKDLLTTKGVILAAEKLNESKITRSWYKYGCSLESRAQSLYKESLHLLQYRRKPSPRDKIIEKAVRDSLDSLMKLVNLDKPYPDVFLEKFYASKFTPEEHKNLYLSQIRFKRKFRHIINCAKGNGSVRKELFKDVLNLSESMKDESIKVLLISGRADLIPNFLEMGGIIDLFIANLYENRNSTEFNKKVSQVAKAMNKHFTEYYWLMIASLNSILSMNHGLKREEAISSRKIQIDRITRARTHLTRLFNQLNSNGLNGNLDQLMALSNEFGAQPTKKGLVKLEGALKQAI